MNRLKRLISMLLCTTLMFTSVCVFAEGTEETTGIAEPIEIDWDSIGLLEKLGIIDEIDRSTAQEFLSEKISRAEFAVNIIRFANIENVISMGEGFKDVVKDAEEAPYIYTAVNMGLIAPVTEEYFYPMYGINYEEAAQALVMTLGYSAVAKTDNSWFIQAKKLGLMKGVDTGKAFTRAQGYQMLFNALHAEVMDVSGLVGDVASYTTVEGFDALKKFFDIRHDEGIITGAGGVEFDTGKTNSQKEYVKQNGNLYKYGKHDLNTVIGRNAVIYYNGNKDAIYILKKRNTELVLTSQDIAGYNNLIYTYGDKLETAKIESPYVILNGEEYLGAFTQTVMWPSAGSVTLVDNNNDGVYNIVIIKAYTDHKVKYLLEAPDRVLDIYGEEINLDSGSYDVQIYDSMNMPLDFDDLTAESIISVARSGSKVDVYVSTEKIEGSVSSIRTVNGIQMWRINDTDYPMAVSLKNELASASPRIDKMKMSLNYTFYFNVYGEIVYYDEGVSSVQDNRFYAVLTAAKLEGIGNDQLTIKAFAKEFGGFETLTVPKRITLNGSNATPEGVYNALKRDGYDGYFSTDGKIVAQPVKIEVNENNEITYLSQASVAEYYTSIGRTDLPAAPTDITPEFILYMGSLDIGGRHVAWREVIEQGMWLEGTAGKTDTVKKRDWPYSSDDPLKGYRHLAYDSAKGGATIYDVPFYLSGPDKGKMAVEKEKQFVMSKVGQAAWFKMFSYIEPDGVELAFGIKIIDADAKATTGSAHNLRAVVEITREYIDEEPVTALKTNKDTFYISDGTYDLNALQLYDYSNNPRYNADGSAMTYKVNPGDIVNIVADSNNFITAIEAVYDSTNKVMLGSGNANTPTSYAFRDAAYHLVKVDIKQYSDGYIIGVEGDITAYNPDTDSLFMTITPSSMVKVEKGRNGITTGKPTATDYIGYDDSTTEYATALISRHYMAVQGAAFLYPHE